MQRTEMTLDAKTLDMFRSCKTKGFPLCLDSAIVKIFNHRKVVHSVASKGGFKARATVLTKDVWENYYEYLRSLERMLGRGPEAVIEHQSLREMETLGCTMCPVYLHGIGRDKSRFNADLPRKADVKGWAEPSTSRDG